MAKDNKMSKIKKAAIGTGIGLGTGPGFMLIENIAKAFGFKDGGKVRGCGIAKRGFGKAMKRKK